MADWFLFDTDTGDYFGRVGTKLGAERKVAKAWKVPRHSLKIEYLSEGGVMLTPPGPCEECDDTGHGLVVPCGTCGGAPRGFYALPSTHPSITVRTALMTPGEYP